MEFNLDISKEELTEIAKMAYIAQYVVDSSGTFSTSYHYPHFETFENAIRKLNKAILEHLPDSKFLEVDGNITSVFTHTLKMEDDMKLLVETFTEDCFLSRICSAVSRRDYKEKYGCESNVRFIEDGSVYDLIYQNNMKELMANGLKNWRLQE